MLCPPIFSNLCIRVSVSCVRANIDYWYAEKNFLPSMCYISVFLINRLNNSRKIVRESRIFLVLQSVNCEVHHILNLSLFWFGVDGGNQKASSVITSCDIMHAT